MEEIIARIEKEMEVSNMQYISEIGKIVIAHIRACSADAFCITSDKTLQGCFDFLKDRARKNQKNGCGVAGDADVYDYFGFGGEITQQPRPEPTKPQASAEKRAHINISDLFD